jgi:pilus assembly protein Flp/PilA
MALMRILFGKKNTTENVAKILTFFFRDVYPAFRWRIVFGYPTGKWREKAETWHTLTRLAGRGMFYDQRWLRRPQPFILDKEIGLMLKFYAQANDLLYRLRTDREGVVSFEYIIVAACIVGAVALAFGNAAGGPISAALTAGLGGVIAAFATAAPPAG